ncbi:HNH endonuclease [Afipia carboxidovorans]|uniref:HNH endonuclease n=1 Tax=Afipia carboxidovorans TaxID=40137 RepID=UPI0030CCF795
MSVQPPRKSLTRNQRAELFLEHGGISKTISISELRTRIAFDPATGILTWRFNPAGRAQWNGRFAGKRASNVSSHGYVRVNFKRRLLYGHRVAWAIFYGEWPVLEIDHINGCGTDNRISNLRLATRTQNVRNIRRSSANKSGYKGVCLFRQTGRWAAAISVNNKTIHLGFFSTKEAAYEAYCTASQKYHGEFGRVE